MRALTVKQPYADLIIAGVKDVENRTWEPYSTLPQHYRCVEGCGHRMRQTLPHLTPKAHHYRAPDQIVGGEWHDVEPDGPYPFRLAIHAAKKASRDQDAWDLWVQHAPWEWRNRPLEVSRSGAILGTVTVPGCHHADECEQVGHDHYGYGCSEWAEPGCYHWELADPVPLDEPIPATGRQGLWEVDGDVAARLQEAA